MAIKDFADHEKASERAHTHKAFLETIKIHSSDFDFYCHLRILLYGKRASENVQGVDTLENL